MYKFVPIWILLNDVTINIFIKDYESHQLEHWCDIKYDRRLYNKEEVLGKYSRKRKNKYKSILNYLLKITRVSFLSKRGYLCLLALLLNLKLCEIDITARAKQVKSPLLRLQKIKIRQKICSGQYTQGQNLTKNC